MSIKFGIVSDLHTELWEQHDLKEMTRRLHDTLDGADLILLPGDIGNGAEAIRAAKHLFPDKPVCMVAGNHEFWGLDIDKTYQSLANEATGSNVQFLNRQAYKQPGLRVLGATLWTDFDLFGNQPVSMAAIGTRNYKCNGAFFSTPYPDFRMIFEGKKYATPHDLLRRHEQDWQWLKQQLDEPFDDLTVVLTHHAPVSFSLAEHHVNDPLSTCFASRLENHLVRDDVHLVVWGHTHHAVDRTIDHTRFVSNQVGYLSRTLNRPGYTETGEFGTIIELDLPELGSG